MAEDERIEETEEISEDEVTEPVAEAEEKAEVKPDRETRSSKADRKREQTPEENAAWKKRRLQWEAEKRQLEGELKESRKQVQALRTGSVSDEALADLNITRDDLSDPDNLRLAELYTEATRKGEENPAAYAYRMQNAEYRGQSQKARQAEEERRTISENARKDRAEASRKYGKEWVDRTLNSDSDFMRLYGNILTHDNFAVLLEAYRTTSDSRARSMGGFSRSGGKPAEAKADPDFLHMTDEEFSEYKRRNGL